MHNILRPKGLQIFATCILLAGCQAKSAELVACSTSPLNKELVVSSNVINDDLSFEILKHPQFVGVMFPAEAKGAGLPQRKGDDAKFWTPTKAEIIEAESTFRSSLEGKLKDALQQSEDPRNAEIIPSGLCYYNRQYVGTMHAGKKRIDVNLFRARETLPYEGLTWLTGPSKWETRAVVVYGGGANFFRANYDISSRSWDWVQVNSHR